ncbi:hypothetical protein I7I50_09530 [Histoplasma capsulatum G186AR]|uniref:Uncharacterized protein n=1 Tax=Ajellomyces capsulatus TaxID=5037 RepID=A0A8H7YUB4_AJECA|nr:hypothetical protein I7I52_07051 [Histoplasma capsulatum]QSS74391.1 hypothetical protein I7I50_09530 [Histoplasma capsulatum G186AR]
MTSPTTWRWLLALAAGVVPAAMAQICTPDDGSWGYAYMVRNQSDLDVIAASCTTINGSLIMGVNYTGPFSLPNVRNITSLFRSEALTEPPYHPAPISADLPDLEFLGDGPWFGDLSTLTNFSAPNLKRVGHEVRLRSVQSVNLASLEEAESLRIEGNIDRLQLDTLKRISEGFVICNSDNCDDKKIPITSLNLSLPSLHTAGRISIHGRLSK